MLSRKSPRIPLPNHWAEHVGSAVLHVISLAQYAAVYTRSWAVDSMNGRDCTSVRRRWAGCSKTNRHQDRSRWK